MPPPSEVGLTDLYWGTTFPLFWGLLVVISSSFFVLMQLFPESDKADLDRFMKRVMFAVILLIIVGFGGFDHLITFFNTIGQSLFPSDFEIGVDMSTMEGIATVGLSGVSALLFIIFTSPKIFLTIGLFIVLLGMRAVIIYSTFVLFPILIVFWIADIGPLSYGKMLADFMFKATILLLFFGIVISLILGIGGEIAGEGLSAPELQQGYEQIENEPPEGDRVSGGGLQDEDPQFSTTGMGPLTGAWFSVFVYFASIWLCIFLTSIVLGGTASTGLGKNVGKGAKLKSKASSIKGRIDDARGSGDSNSNNSSISDDMGINPENDTEGNDGETMGDDRAPEPENNNESTWESVKSSYTDTKESVSDSVENAKEKGQEMKENAKSDFSKKHPTAAKGAFKTIGGIKKGANLAKRGGKAGYSIWNQSASDTLGEAGRIARESPIGAPPEDWGTDSKEDKKSQLEDDPVTLSDLTQNGFSDKGRPDQERHNTQFGLEGTYEYTHETNREVGDGDGNMKDMQKGHLTDTETGEQIPYVGFGDFENGEGTKLEDGEEYEFGQGVECRQFDVEKYHENSQHDNVSDQSIYTGERDDGSTGQFYDQVCATEDTEVNKVGNRSRGN